MVNKKEIKNSGINISKETKEKQTDEEELKKEIEKYKKRLQESMLYDKKEIEKYKKILQERMLYDEKMKVSLKYNKNVNPEIDFDILESILKGFFQKRFDEFIKRLKGSFGKGPHKYFTSKSINKHIEKLAGDFK